MSETSIAQSAPTRNPTVALVPAGSIGENEVPSLIEVAGRFVHAPILEDNSLIVDTGTQIVSLSASEVAVLRAVFTAFDAPEVTQ